MPAGGTAGKRAEPPVAAGWTYLTLTTMPTVHTSACPLDCPDSCSLEVRVEGGRVVKLDGDRRNPMTQGFICSKVRGVPELLYGPGPKLRQFRRCPGANEMPASDGSNVLSGDEAAALDCDPSQRSVGP